MRQTRLLEVHEEKEIWQQREWQEDKVVHRLHSIVYDGQLAQRLEQISQTHARTKRAHQLLRHRFDVANDGSLADGARRLENECGNWGARDAETLGRVDHGADEQWISEGLREADVEESDIMRCLYQVISIVHSCEYGHGLDGDHKLGHLQISIVLVWKLHQEG